MADYSALKATIDASINTNGQQAITGAILNDVLNEMVDVLGEGYQFMGVAQPTDTPATTDAKVCYLAATAGTYANFGNITLADGEVAVLCYNGAWEKKVTGWASAESVLQLDTSRQTSWTGTTSMHPSRIDRLAVSIKRGEKFILRLDGTNGVAYFYNSNDSLSFGSKNCQDGMDYTITAADDIEEIGVYHDTLTADRIVTLSAIYGESFDVRKNTDDIAKLSDKMSQVDKIYDDMYSYQTSEDVEYNTAMSGKAIDQDGVIYTNPNYSISSPISLATRQKLDVSVVNNGACVIALVEGDRYVPLVIGSYASYFSYQYIADDDCQVVICWKSASGAPQYVTISTPESIANNVEEVTEEVGALTQRVDTLDATINGGEVAITDVPNSGYIYADNLYSSSIYHYTNPIELKKGQVVIVNTYGNEFSPINLTDAEGSYYQSVVTIVNTSATDSKEVTYTALDDCYVVICVRASNPYSIKMSVPPITERITASGAIYNAAENVGNMTIVAAKEHHYTDGTPPVIEWYLLREPVTGNFYYSKDLKGKNLIFNFPYASNYAFGILNNGDIIAVRLAASLPFTSSDDNRVNPYYFKASEKWAEPHELDFGTRLKPCGWLENCGFLALDNGDCIFTEYTRISVETCNVWKISGDVADAENWQVKKTFVLSGQVDAGLKHLHAVQQDFYNGIIYISTGDYEASSIYASFDGGDTFEAVLENNERKCRSLAMTFTPDYVCWGNDSVQHVFVRCSRLASGLIDIDNADVIEIPKTSGGALAFYGQSYLSEINSVLLLDRQDGGGTAPSFPLYLVDVGTLAYKAIGRISAVGDNPFGLGFRTLFSEWYPINGHIHFGFGFDQTTKNIIATCGNKDVAGYNGDETINNLILDVAIYAENPTMRFRTLWI